MKNFFLERCSCSLSIIKSNKNAIAGINILKLVILMFILLVQAGHSKATPSFARQTGMSCTACHYSFPELTLFGRQFKLNAYTMTMMNTIESKQDSDKVTRLKLLSYLPLSAMVQTSFTSNAKANEGTQNNSIAFPQQISMFYAGQITPHIGSFIQMTYDGKVFGMDNAEIRYANQTSLGNTSLLYGVTLNNNPTVQDVWNTTPAWGFPTASSDAANTPAKSTLIENLGMQVAGLGAYALLANFLYGEITFYRSSPQGAANPADSTSRMTIKGLAPYWRAALQHAWGNSYVEIGTFGITSNNYLSGISGATDQFTDLGFDLQVEHTINAGALVLHSSMIRETEKRNSTLANYHFNSFKMDGNFYLKNGLGATVGYFNSSGTRDAINVESATNKPDSNGFIYQIEYLPWYNTKFSIQYVTYSKFNGSSQSAADNNTLYLLAWFNF
ncbi:MAG: hypothetical protein ACM3P1_00385 [Candidatus Saccharibacteria bacterium]